MAAPTPFHEQNQENYVDTRKWYLQDEFLKPKHPEINKNTYLKEMLAKDPIKEIIQTPSKSSK